MGEGAPVSSAALQVRSHGQDGREKKEKKEEEEKNKKKLWGAAETLVARPIKSPRSSDPATRAREQVRRVTSPPHSGTRCAGTDSELITTPA